MKILVVEDDLHLQKLLEYNLEQEGYRVILEKDGLEAYKKIEQINPDFLILDLMLPSMDGLEICKRVRENQKLEDIPIIMLTAKASEFDKVLGLELGADDYLAKPFSVNELKSRIKALTRRMNLNKREVLEELVDSKLLRVDLKSYEVFYDEEKLDLSLKEYQLLVTLMGRKDKVFTRNELLESVWDYDYLGDTRTVDVHIRYLRKKINKNLVETIRGIGYKFKGQ